MKITDYTKRLIPVFFITVLTIFTVSYVSANGASTNNTPVEAPVSSYQRVFIDALSLSNNIISEPTLRDILVYLPTAYFTSEARLPVIYFLPGFGANSIGDVKVKTDFDHSFTKLQPSIVVIIPGTTRFGGGFFVDSAVTGKWSEFVVKDVVNYIDANYRTLAKRQSRGIAGHSMGGFGALDLAMRHSDVFGSVFAMAPGLVSNKGITDTQMFDSEAHIKQFITSTAAVKNSTAKEALISLLNHPNKFDIAYGMAFAPMDTPPYFEYPYRLQGNTLVRDDAILAKWNSGFGAVQSEISEFKTQLKSLNGIGLDCGRNDEFQWIVRGCDYYSSELKAAGIEHIYTTHEGFHMKNLRERTLDFMLPFFSQRLETK